VNKKVVEGVYQLNITTRNRHKRSLVSFGVVVIDVLPKVELKSISFGLENRFITLFETSSGNKPPYLL
jgi:hypothetical protein